MSNPYIGEIRMFGGNFPPAGWAFCNGQLLPISEYDILFNLIGTTYGGDGQQTFALPDLQGRVPLHSGTGSGLSTYTLGESAGVETVTLTTNQIPIHNHALQASTAGGTSSSPSGQVLAASNTVSLYKAGTPVAAMAAAAVNSDGGSQPHENMQPYLAVSFIISLFGVYPSQN